MLFEGSHIDSGRFQEKKDAASVSAHNAHTRLTSKEGALSDALLTSQSNMLIDSSLIDIDNKLSDVALETSDARHVSLQQPDVTLEKSQTSAITPRLCETYDVMNKTAQISDVTQFKEQSQVVEEPKRHMNDSETAYENRIDELLMQSMEPLSISDPLSTIAYAESHENKATAFPGDMPPIKVDYEAQAYAYSAPVEAICNDVQAEQRGKIIYIHVFKIILASS